MNVAPNKTKGLSWGQVFLKSNIIYNDFQGAHQVMLTIRGNEHEELSSNPGQDYLDFT